MKQIALSFGILLIIAESHLAKACDAAHNPFSELLNHFDPRLHSAVEGYFISQKTFKVTKSYHPAIKIGSENKVLEYGPYRSTCEVCKVENGINQKFIGAVYCS